MIKVAPSVLAADFSALAEDVAKVVDADWLHVDVMDGHFVPNITMGPAIVQALGRVTDKPLDVHLMIEQPEQYVGVFAEAGASVLTVHAEATNHLHRLLGQIKDLGVKAGVAYNPGTSLAGLEYVLDLVDLVLIMTVNPGFGGQSFIPATLGKIAEARALIQSSGREIALEVDGGIDLTTGPMVVEAGADVLVAGSAVFQNEQPNEMVKRLRSIGRE